MESDDEEYRLLKQRALQLEAEVDELERQRLLGSKQHLPRTLVDNIIKYRKNIRNLDIEIATKKDKNTNVTPTITKEPIGRYGTKLRPGQEDTCDILDAVPPASNYQRTKFLDS